MRRIIALLALLLACGPIVKARAQQCFPELQCRVTAPPPLQVIATGDTIRDDACGTVKRLQSLSGGGNTTSATLPFPTPSTNNAGCVMQVCNMGAGTVTIKHLAAFFLTTTGADLVLAANGCILVASTGATGVWFQLAVMVTDS